jgi:uncharacterized protein (TIGR03118 family)
MKKTTILSILLAIPGCLAAANQYAQHNLVSDLPGMADRVDANLINPWGIVASPGSPFWISDNSTGFSTLYNGSGVPNALKVPIPAPGNMPVGAASGITFNGTSSFNAAPGMPSSFIFSTENGTIVGWNSQVNTAKGVILVDNSASRAVYKGLAMATRSEGPLLYAANFNAGTIDVFDGNLNQLTLPGAFQDSGIPAGFAPFNIQNLGGTLYVTYAKQDAAKHDDVAGTGNGYVDVYDLNGLLLQRLVVQGALNSPWGLAIAPAGFGDFGGALLVGNFGSGAINAYDINSGNLLGQLKDAKGNVIAIPGLWGLSFGNGSGSGDTNTLYFTAGISGGGQPVESHGLFGSLLPAPAAVQSNAVLNAASFQPAIAPGGFASIQGTNLSTTTRTWGSTDFVSGTLPTQLDGVSVMVDGKPAYIYFVSPRQIDFIPAADSNQGAVPVIVTNTGLASASVTATLQQFSPGFFMQNAKYIVATHANGALVGPPASVGITPADYGETITLWGTGFGPANPAVDGQVVTAPVPSANQVTVSIGGAPATVTFAGLTSTGLYQINVQVPVSIPIGDAAIIAQVGGVKSQANVFISVLHN